MVGFSTQASKDDRREARDESISDSASKTSRDGISLSRLSRASCSPSTPEMGIEGMWQRLIFSLGKSVLFWRDCHTLSSVTPSSLNTISEVRSRGPSLFPRYSTASSRPGNLVYFKPSGKDASSLIWVTSRSSRPWPMGLLRRDTKTVRVFPSAESSQFSNSLPFLLATKRDLPWTVKNSISTLSGTSITVLPPFPSSV